MKLSLAAALITILAPGWAAAEDAAPRQNLQGDLLITDVTIVAATAGAAELYGLEDEIGTVEVGKRADLLLLAEDPTKTIDAFGSIETVILGGRATPREELSARNAR